jgi:hypothetical protein
MKQVPVIHNTQMWFNYFFCIVLSNEKIIMWINCILWFLVILLIVGVLIDNKAFVCLLVCL